MNNNSQKIAVAYLRRSTDRQEQSISDQRRVIAEYAALNDFHLIKEYLDDAISGLRSKVVMAFSEC